jgi:hypothetical protein
VQRRLITTDCHIAPPHSLVDELPESYREYFPRIEERADGKYLVRPESAVIAMMGGGEDPGTKLDDDPKALERAAVGNVRDRPRPCRLR